MRGISSTGVAVTLLLALAAVPECLPTFTGGHRSRRTDPGPEVTVQQGRLLGRHITTAKGTVYSAFSGIPYAAPPVGELRFKGPRPAAGWSGVRDARREGKICTQPMLNLTKMLVSRIPKSMEPFNAAEIPGLVRAQPWIIRAVTNILTSGEDCLFINVYTPKLAARESRAAGEKGLPVVFWVYGGGFIWGEGGLTFYDPEYLMDRGMVVVTFNYRLGALGFLSLGKKSSVSGNAGIKDVAAALRWTRNNVAAFGGDPDKITIWGESGGAVCSHVLMLNPEFAGMMRGAILGSGSAVHFWGSVSAARATARARHMSGWTGCKRDLPALELAECLRKVPAHRLASLYEKALVPEDGRYLTGAVPFIATVEDPDDELDVYDRPVLTENPRALLAAGKYARVPTILGFNSGESLIMYTGLTREPSLATLRLIHDAAPSSFLRDDLLPYLSPEQAEEIGERARTFYFGNDTTIKPYGKSLDNFFEVVTGLFMYVDSIMMARMMASEPGSAPVYMYRFNYVGAINMFKNALRIMQKVACHGDELPYVWKINVGFESRPLTASSPENKLREAFTNMLTNFIKTGSPTPSAASSPQQLTWPAYTAQDQAYLQIGEHMHVAEDFARPVIDMWDDVYSKAMGGPLWGRLAKLEAQRRHPGADGGPDANGANALRL